MLKTKKNVEKISKHQNIKSVHKSDQNVESVLRSK
jgi:hypothetical protein